MSKKYLVPVICVIVAAIVIFTMRFWKIPANDLFHSDSFVIILTVLAVIAGILGYLYSAAAYKVDNNPSLEHYEQDRQSFKKFSLMNIALIISFYVALAAFLMVTLNQVPLWLGILSVVVFLVVIFLRYYGYGMINKLYPERNLPSNFEDHFDDKLIETLSKNEMIVIFTGLYNAFKLVNILLPAAMLLITLYGIETGQPQHFALIVILLSAVCINIIYQLTVRKMI
ncbi:hypothetical protein ERX37_10730 [Macrococcus hajekii]|uniref:DUF3169 family protein n=1 Tax=Macrococcus hajekii TaxID=198482 RepID=A0A4R6BHZ0_9STAP|nr:hypothetical protein [Macrococcus hajekii]TDM01146.1 hypothetical protein ERX37_10730 [Macrococcus hajekii]GGB12099.1 hypothetical protein GCM10007190_20180 [Macrococcus hajekii]